MAALGSAKAIPGYAPLTAVVDELEGVVKRDEADLSGVMPGVIRLDEAFTREALTELLESRKYATYHIASHFVLAGGEGESYLLLGDGQKLSLTDIRYELRFDGVDLLALSACNTAVGEETDGRELEGFASLALRLGARQVLATLWPVGDTSTGRLMQSLYRWQQVVGVGRAEALRLAMLGLIRGTDVKLDDKAKGMAGAVAWGVCGELGGDRHPFHWAPFILVGSWL
jgi:CHAT domain-containing protein